MENTINNTDSKVQIFFLKQGKSINRLHQILDSSILAGFLKRGISFIFEIVLFLSSMALFIVGLWIPLNPVRFMEQHENVTLTVQFHYDDITIITLMIKAALIISAVLILLFAWVLKRNRKKRLLINSAFEEVTIMKKNFDEAIGEMNWGQ